MADSRSITMMTEGNYRRQIIRFAVPVFFGNLFQVLYSTVDSFVVGNTLGAEALAAVSSTSALTNLLIGIFLGFATGASVIIGQMLGAGDRRRTGLAVHSTIALGLVFSVILTTVGVLFTGTFLAWMGTPDDVLPQAALYLRVYFSGAAALIMYNIFTGILQAAGNSKDPVIYLVISSLLNIVLDIVFINSFHMGVDGAALATVISETVSALLSLYRLLISEETIRFHPSRLRFDKEMTVLILQRGLPSSIEWGVTDGANVLIQSYINSFGSMAMAGQGVANRLEGFLFLPITAVRAALSAFTSQNFGAGNYERIRRGYRFGILSAVILIEGLGLLSFILAPRLIAIFNQDPDVIYYGTMRMHVCALFYGVIGYSNIMGGVITGLGRPVIPMLAHLFCWCGVRVLVLMTIGQVFHVYGLCCWIYPLTWSLSSLVFFLYMRHLNRTLLKTDLPPLS